VSAVQWLKLLHTLIYFGVLSSFVIFFVVTVFALSPWPPQLRRRRHTDRIYVAMYSVCAPPTAHQRPNTHLLVTPCPQPARAPAHAPTGTCKGDTHMPLQVLAFWVRSFTARPHRAEKPALRHGPCRNHPPPPQGRLIVARQHVFLAAAPRNYELISRGFCVGEALFGEIDGGTVLAPAARSAVRSLLQSQSQQECP
jgi:hypothetical protein